MTNAQSSIDLYQNAASGNSAPIRTEQTQHPSTTVAINKLKQRVNELETELATVKKQLTASETAHEAKTKELTTTNQKLLREVANDTENIFNYLCIKDVIKDSVSLQYEFEQFLLTLQLVVGETEYGVKLREAKFKYYNKIGL